MNTPRYSILHPFRSWKLRKQKQQDETKRKLQEQAEYVLALADLMFWKTADEMNLPVESYRWLSHNYDTARVVAAGVLWMRLYGR